VVDLPPPPSALRGLHLSTAGAPYDPSETRIAVDRLSVRYDLQQERVISVREYAIRRLRGERFPTRTLWPIEDVSFQVQAGESFGIVGRNGAGKSTLLKVIAGIVPPTRGRVEVRGHLSPLLELGAGFDMELTGRENVQLYGTLLGLRRKHLRDRIDAIADFAELTPFIDVPLKNYSSGMIARLAFAIATDSDPDILIVDEVLSVGDAPFQRKCEERLGRFHTRGVTVLLVTHNLDLLTETCSRAVLLEPGSPCLVGPAKEIAARYAERTGG
jgi:ABC-type polysaccharide/polyol phosphate transport system ATPase subunit